MNNIIYTSTNINLNIALNFISYLTDVIILFLIFAQVIINAKRYLKKIFKKIITEEYLDSVERKNSAFIYMYVFLIGTQFIIKGLNSLLIFIRLF